MIKVIPNHLNYYADEDGNIYSNMFSSKVKGSRRNDHERPLRKIRPYTCKAGAYYLVVTVRDKFGVKKKRYVHELVLETFVGPRLSGMEACHGVLGSLNNSLSNLYWGSHSQNMLDKHRDGTMTMGEEHPLAKLNPFAVRTIRRLHKTKSCHGMTNADIARPFNVTPQLISKVAHRVVWKHIA